MEESTFNNVINLKKINKIDMIDILQYECHSHWLAPYISFDWGHELLGRYFAWKVKRKYNRYSRSLDSRELLRTIANKI